MKKLLDGLYKLHRTLNSEGTDCAYNLLLKNIPKNDITFNKLHEYTVGDKAWTWRIPPRYKVNKAVLKDVEGNIYADFNEHFLYIWDYSISINKKVTWEELEKHLYYSKVMPDSIPFYFKYYDKTWGFSIEYNKYLKMPRDIEYIVEIDSEFIDEKMKNLTTFIDYQQEKDFLICTNICHPMQLNDSISGVIAAIDLIKRLDKTPVDRPTKNINFLFCPETIGSIAYLSQNENKIEQTSSAFFTEMIGHKDDENFILQISRNPTDMINSVFEYVFKKKEKSFSIRGFERWNDEGNINGPGVNIPCPYIMKGTLTGDKRAVYSTDFYKEYHTSADNLDIISIEKIEEAVDIFEEVVRIYCSDYIPKQKEKGIIFLSGLNMHISFYDNPNAGLFMDQIVYLLEGTHSVFEISKKLDMDYWEVKKFIDQLYDKGAIEKIII